MAKAGETQPVASMSVEDFVSCSDILPPKRSDQLIAYFDRLDFEASQLRGYRFVARRVVSQLVWVTSVHASVKRRPWILPLAPEEGPVFIPKDEPEPVAIRSLLEMTYFLTKAEIVDVQTTKERETLSLNGIFDRKPLNFKERQTKAVGGIFMDWEVRLERVPQEIEEDIYRRNQRPMPGEQREMIVGVEEALALLPNVREDSPYYNR